MSPSAAEPVPRSTPSCGEAVSGEESKTLSFGEIADLIGYSRQWVRKLFRERKTAPSLYILRKLQRKLHYDSVDEVLDLIAKMRRQTIRAGTSARVPVKSRKRR